MICCLQTILMAACHHHYCCVKHQLLLGARNQMAYRAASICQVLQLLVFRHQSPPLPAMLGRPCAGWPSLSYHTRHLQVSNQSSATCMGDPPQNPPQKGPSPGRTQSSCACVFENRGSSMTRLLCYVPLGVLMLKVPPMCRPPVPLHWWHHSAPPHRPAAAEQCPPASAGPLVDWRRANQHVQTHRHTQNPQTGFLLG